MNFFLSPDSHVNASHSTPVDGENAPMSWQPP